MSHHRTQSMRDTDVEEELPGAAGAVSAADVVIAPPHAQTDERAANRPKASGRRESTVIIPMPATAREPLTPQEEPDTRLVNHTLQDTEFFARVLVFHDRRTRSPGAPGINPGKPTTSYSAASNAPPHDRSSFSNAHHVEVFTFRELPGLVALLRTVENTSSSPSHEAPFVWVDMYGFLPTTVVPGASDGEGGGNGNTSPSTANTPRPRSYTTDAEASAALHRLWQLLGLQPSTVHTFNHYTTTAKARRAAGRRLRGQGYTDARGRQPRRVDRSAIFAHSPTSSSNSSDGDGLPESSSSETDSDEPLAADALQAFSNEFFTDLEYMVEGLEVLPRASRAGGHYMIAEVQALLQEFPHQTLGAHSIGQRWLSVPEAHEASGGPLLPAETVFRPPGPHRGAHQGQSTDPQNGSTETAPDNQTFSDASPAGMRVNSYYRRVPGRRRRRPRHSGNGDSSSSSSVVATGSALSSRTTASSLPRGQPRRRGGGTRPPSQSASTTLSSAVGSQLDAALADVVAAHPGSGVPLLSGPLFLLVSGDRLAVTWSPYASVPGNLSRPTPEAPPERVTARWVRDWPVLQSLLLREHSRGAGASSRGLAAALVREVVLLTAQAAAPRVSALLGAVDTLDAMLPLIAPDREADQADALRRVLLVRRGVARQRQWWLSKSHLCALLQSPQHRLLMPWLSLERGASSTGELALTTAAHGAVATTGSLAEVRDACEERLQELRAARTVLGNSTLIYSSTVCSTNNRDSTATDYYMLLLSYLSLPMVPLSCLVSQWGMNCLVPGQRSENLTTFGIIVSITVAVIIVSIAYPVYDYRRRRREVR